MANIHPTAIVAKSAQLADDINVGAYAIIGEEVKIGAGSEVYSHTIITGKTTIGKNNKFFHHAIIGEISQDKKYKGEPSQLIIGDNNVFREFCTINSGEIKGDQYTRIGNFNTFLNYSHVGHNSQIGDNCVFVNAVQIAGHVIIGDFVTIGAGCGVHQFCKIGSHVMVGAYSTILRDVLPFVLCDGRPARAYTINKIGLKRRGFSEQRIKCISDNFDIIYRQGKSREEIVRELNAKKDDDSQLIINFINNSQRGFIRTPDKGSQESLED